MAENLEIKTQEQAIRYFIEKMDIEMIDDILSNKNTYQDFKKHIFIKKLSDLFETFKSSGDTFLITVVGKCNTCFKGKEGYTFIGNNSRNYVSILIDVQQGLVKDMFECSDFIELCNSIKLNKKLYIDKPRFPF